MTELRQVTSDRISACLNLLDSFKNSKKGQSAIRGERATTVTACKKEFDIQAPKKEEDSIIRDESEAARIKKNERKTRLRENSVKNYTFNLCGNIPNLLVFLK